jgi:hypothetical protein
MKTFKTFLSEIFDKSVHFTDITSIGDRAYKYSFYVDGNHYRVRILEMPDNSWLLSFAMVDQSEEYRYGNENVGLSTSIIVFSTVMEIVKVFIKKKNPNEIRFMAEEEEDSYRMPRSNLYTSLVKKYIPTGWRCEIETKSGYTKYTLIKK